MTGSSLDLTTDEERISILEDKSTEIAQSETQREKRMGRNQITHRTAVHNIKKSNVCIIGITKGERRESEKQVFEEIMANNFLKQRKIPYHRLKKLRECKTE